MDVGWLLGSWGPWQCWLCWSTSGYCHRRYGTVGVFSSLWLLCPVRIVHEAACVTGTLVAPSVQDDNSLRLRSHGTIESFSSLWQLVSKGPPWLGSFSIAWHIRHLKGHPLWGLSLFISCQCQCVERERGYSDGSTLCLTQQYCLASMAA